MDSAIIILWLCLFLVAHTRGGTIVAAAAAGRLTLFLLVDQINDNEHDYEQQNRAYNNRSQIGCQKFQHKISLQIAMGSDTGTIPRARIQLTQ